eukprot:2082210-Rhodomonas_salina.1
MTNQSPTRFTHLRWPIRPQAGEKEVAELGVDFKDHALAVLLHIIQRSKPWSAMLLACTQNSAIQNMVTNAFSCCGDMSTLSKSHHRH